MSEVMCAKCGKVQKPPEVYVFRYSRFWCSKHSRDAVDLSRDE